MIIILRFLRDIVSSRIFNVLIFNFEIVRRYTFLNPKEATQGFFWKKYEVNRIGRQEFTHLDILIGYENPVYDLLSDMIYRLLPEGEMTCW